MVFMCQEDSYLQKFSTKVIKCEPTNEKVIEYGKTTEFEGYAITLDNTILFPAGGGQPHDHGYLNNIEVYQVLRKGCDAVHFTKEPFTPGTEVEQVLDWKRRFDHMQQHSGQHLLSAILDKRGIPTLSWWLGADECYVELDAPTLKEDVIREVEQQCNKHIKQNLPVNVRLKNIDDPSLNESGRNSKGLPEDCNKTIRIICIGDVDENMCCGTHVSSLGQLQMIKLLGVNAGKKGKYLLRFVVGNRVLKSFQQCLNHEKEMSEILNTDSTKHATVVGNLQRKYKILNKNLNNLLSEVALYEVEKFKQMKIKPKFAFIYKKEGNADFNRIIQKGLENENVFVFIASDDFERAKEGQVIMQGPDIHCDILGKQICDLLQCKGAFKNGKFQGKATNMSAIAKCQKLVEDYFDSITT